MEQKDIDEEQELTGTYISIDAGDVESAIDPRTGKNITITGAKKEKDAAAKKAAGGEQRVGPSWLPGWLAAFLNDAPDKDDQDFWDPPAAAEAPTDPFPPKGGGSPSADGGGGAGGGAPGDSGAGGDDDDTSGIDALNDLLGG